MIAAPNSKSGESTTPGASSDATGGTSATSSNSDGNSGAQARPSSGAATSEQDEEQLGIYNPQSAEQVEDVLNSDMLSAEEVEIMKSMGVKTAEEMRSRAKKKSPRSKWNEEDLLAESEAREYALQTSSCTCTRCITNFTNLECKNTCHARLGSEPSFVMQRPHLYAYGKFTVDSEILERIDESSNGADADGDQNLLDQLKKSSMTLERIAQLHAHPPDMEAAISHYWKVSNMQVTGEWMQHFVARASFNLGILICHHNFNIGKLAFFQI